MRGLSAVAAGSGLNESVFARQIIDASYLEEMKGLVVQMEDIGLSLAFPESWNFKDLQKKIKQEDLRFTIRAFVKKLIEHAKDLESTQTFIFEIDLEELGNIFSLSKFLSAFLMQSHPQAFEKAPELREKAKNLCQSTQLICRKFLGKMAEQESFLQLWRQFFENLKLYQEALKKEDQLSLTRLFHDVSAEREALSSAKNLLLSSSPNSALGEFFDQREKEIMQGFDSAVQSAASSLNSSNGLELLEARAAQNAENKQNPKKLEESFDPDYEGSLSGLMNKFDGL